ncbi:zinc transporter 1 [Aethina tumida]|uniref:zinc transporter 1 n=1 Tax=Aethina tumida TaxID=116153 RepID=UPI00096ADA23|nr:zinc transporter 1 [Aethina tumida]XP_019869875.1 zinc transporter 1 [Aethina tumida]XP_049825791.1 zinc transporter 1 [Aethina tumida]
MGVKEWFRQMQPVQLYVILVITILFFIVELTVSHITHSLTLLMDSYQMLCNIFALTGCLISIKHGSHSTLNSSGMNKAESVASNIGEELTSTNPKGCQEMPQTKTSKAKQKKLKNTFGWARIDILSMLFCCVFLASVCFSIFVEAVQTLVHIDHMDEMHHPIPILCIGCCGLIINGLSYLLIGGFTFHQGSFLYVTASGDVILNKVVVNDVRSGARRLSRTKNVRPSTVQPRQRQGIKEMLRDVIGCILVILCSICVYYADKNEIAKYIDPVVSLVFVAVLTILSYPYMKESCFILLQTIPDTIDIESLKTELLQHFPEIVNVHDFHVWQLTASKIISTVHIIFQNPKVYKRIMNDINEFFIDNGITQVTIQPEFFTNSTSTESLADNPPLCLVACQCEGCKEKMCCKEIESPRSLASSKEVIDPSAVQSKTNSTETLDRTTEEKVESGTISNGNQTTVTAN